MSRYSRIVESWKSAQSRKLCWLSSTGWSHVMKSPGKKIGRGCIKSVIDNSWVKHRGWFVERLKAINHYERFFCYLSFLSLLSGLLIWLVSIVTRFLFVGLIEIVGRRHFPWNPNDLISSDLFWSVLIWSKPQNLISWSCLNSTAIR